MGKVEWPFPAPLVKSSAGWKFDGKAGVEEIRDRQIGRNELAAMLICQVNLDVQLEYFASDEQFGNVAGLDNLKDWLVKRTQAFTERAQRFGLDRAASG